MSLLFLVFNLVSISFQICIDTNIIISGKSRSAANLGVDCSSVTSPKLLFRPQDTSLLYFGGERQEKVVCCMSNQPHSLQDWWVE